MCLRAGWRVHAGPPLQMRRCHPVQLLSDARHQPPSHYQLPNTSSPTPTHYTLQCSIATRVDTCHHSCHCHYDSRVRTTTTTVMRTMTTSFPGPSYPIAYPPNTPITTHALSADSFANYPVPKPTSKRQTRWAGVVHPSPSLPAVVQQARLGGTRAAASIKPAAAGRDWDCTPRPFLARQRA